MVVISTHKNASLNPIIIRWLTAIAMAFGSWKKILAMVFGANTKMAVTSRPQTPTVRREARYPFLPGAFYRHQFCAVNAFNAAAKPSAVCQDMDSICPPTRCVARASAPNPETMRVNIIEIKQ